MQGHIRKRIHTTTDGQRTINWHVVIDIPRDTDGKRRQKWHGGFRTRREAEAARAKIVHEFNTGTYVEPSAVTLSEWVYDLWLPTIQTRVKPSTFDSYRRNLDLHVILRLGSRQLRQLTPSMLNRLYSDLLTNGHSTREGGLSAKTVRYIHTIVRHWLMQSMPAWSGSTSPSVRSLPGP